MARTTQIEFLTGLLLSAMVVLLFPTAVQGTPADVFIIIYATHDGKTGHAGIAIDKYEVKISDCRSCPDRVLRDTVRSGELLYFDLWPQQDHFDKDRLFEAIPSQVFRLPASSAERAITIGSLLYRGIPHEAGYPCDGLLRIRTSPAEDQRLITYLDRLAAENRPFQAIDFNCADFVEQGVEYLLGVEVQADERVLFLSVTTPNQLYRSLSTLPAVKIIKDPGELIHGSFWKERILKNNN